VQQILTDRAALSDQTLQLGVALARIMGEIQKVVHPVEEQLM
jgi:hypothetical protein